MKFSIHKENYGKNNLWTFKPLMTFGKSDIYLFIYFYNDI